MDAAIAKKKAREQEILQSLNRLPVPSPGDLLDPGIEPMSPELQAGYLPSEPMVTQELMLNTSKSLY